MFELNLISAGAIIFHLLVILRVYKDNIYLLEGEKMKYILLVIFLPVIGALYTLHKTGCKWMFFSRTNNNFDIGDSSTFYSNKDVWDKD